MPVMDGYEATKQIKARPTGQEIPIIALTANVFEHEKQAILGAGCDDFVHKPFQEAEIFDKLIQHLGVRFIYEEEFLTDLVRTEASHQKPITAAALAVLPPERLADLGQAAKEINLEKVKAIIDQINQKDESVAQVLADLVENFRFDTLQSLVEEVRTMIAAEPE